MTIDLEYVITRRWLDAVRYLYRTGYGGSAGRVLGGRSSQMMLAVLAFAAIPSGGDLCLLGGEAEPPRAVQARCRSRVRNLCTTCAKYGGAWVCEALINGPGGQNVCQQKPSDVCVSRPRSPFECGLGGVTSGSDFCPDPSGTPPAVPTLKQRTCRIRVIRLCDMCAKYPGTWVCEALIHGPGQTSVCGLPQNACWERPQPPSECPP